MLEHGMCLETGLVFSNMQSETIQELIPGDLLRSLGYSEKDKEYVFNLSEFKRTGNTNYEF